MNILDIGNNFYKYETNFEYLNDFETNLFLSLSNTKDQIYNIKAIPKLINDSSVINSLFHINYGIIFKIHIVLKILINKILKI